MKDLEKLFKKLNKERECKVLISQNGISIEGSDCAVLTCLAIFVDTLEKEIGIDKDRIEHAIQVGMMSDEEMNKSATKKMEKFKKLIKEDDSEEEKEFNLGEAIDELKGLLDELKNIDKED